MKKSVSLITLAVYIIILVSSFFTFGVSANSNDMFLPKMYFNANYDISHGFSQTSLSASTITVSDGKAILKLPSGKKSSDFADIQLISIAEETDYVIEAEFTPVSIGSNCSLGFFDSKDSSGIWRYGGSLTNDGNITAYDGNQSKEIDVGTWTANQKVRISYVYHTASSAYDVYLNGVCAKSGLGCSDIVPQSVRIDISASALLSSWCKGLEVHMDNYRVYSGSRLIEDNYSSVVYSSNNFDYSLGLTVNRNGGSIEIANVDGDNMAHFYTSDGEKSSSYADLNVPLITASDDYVVEADIIVNKMDSGSFINLFDSKDSNAKWRLGLRLENGGVYAKKNGSVFLGAGNFSKNVKNRFAVVFHTNENTYDAYLNGKLVYKNVECTPSEGYIFRIDIVNNGTGSIDFYVDNIRSYAGTVFMSDSSFDNFTSSIMNQEQGVKKFLEGSAAYSVNNVYYFADNEKHTYTIDAQKPIEVDGEAYVSTSFLSDILGITDSDAFVNSSDSVYVSDGNSYVPANDAANHIGKEYLYDKRGFFVISDEVFPYVDSDNFIEMFEVSDYLYRYLCFANPTGSEFLNDFNKVTPKGKHPRIVYNDEDISHIKQKMKTDQLWQGRVNNIINSADNIISTYDGKFTADCSDSNKQSQANAFQVAMETLSVAYLVTDDAKYADKAIEYMKILASWETLGWQVANLTTGHWAMGMAIGYDSFYNYMMSTEQGKADIEYIKNAIIRLPFADTISAYSGNGGPRWITIRDNFMGVIGGGVMSLVLALADEEDIKTEIEYLADNIIKSLEIATSLYYPNGGYFEGVSYSAYMLENLSYGMEALWKCCGTDYGLGNAKGFSEAGAFFVYMQTKKGAFNFHDCGPEYFVRSKIPYWLAYRYGETEIAKLWYKQSEIYNVIFDLASLFFADKGINCEGDASNAPLDYYFPVTDVGSFRSDFESSKATFVGFHGGRTGLTHDMLDLGEFVFEAEGVDWAIDLGSDNYSLPGYFAHNGYKIYRKNPEGENCLVINPKNNMNEDGTMSWYGQKINAYAPLTLMESAPRAAMAAYNLTDAYDRDVNAYTRGYYFGDERTTLLVQDELSLKTASEIYWFMHTKADVEIIDSTTARLSRNGKTLTAKLYCNVAGFEFKVMEAKPLPTSPDITGQTANTYARKLTVYIPEASGNVQIGVKLIPDDILADVAPITDTKISEWTLPEGEIQLSSKLKDISVDKFNKLSANVFLAKPAISSKLYIDGSFVCDVDVADSENKVISCVDVSYLDNGTHIATLDISYADGSEESISSKFNCTIYKKDMFYENDLSKFYGTTISTPTGWNLGATGKAESSESGFTLTPTSAGSPIWLDYRGSSSKTFSGDRMVVAFDVEFSKASGNFVIECQNSAGSWFMHGLRIFNNGKTADGRTVEANKKYHVEMVLDPSQKKGCVYVDGIIAAQTASVPTPLNLILMKLQYTPSVVDSKVTYSDFEVFELVNDTMAVNVELSADSDMLNLSAVPTDKSLSYIVFVAHYSEDKMISAECFTATGGFSESVNVPNDAVYSKAFVTASDNMPEPMALPNYYRNR